MYGPSGYGRQGAVAGYAYANAAWSCPDGRDGWGPDPCAAAVGGYAAAPYGYAPSHTGASPAALDPSAPAVPVWNLRHEGGPHRELQEWVRGNAEFFAWARAQGPGFIGLIESVGELSPDNWNALAGAYSAQLSYMGQRWPNGMAFLRAAVAEFPRHHAAGQTLYASGAAMGGPYAELQQWARSNPDFLAWAKAQGSGWTGLLDSLGEVSPDHWSYLAKAYSVQMNYMAHRWPNGMALLNASLAAGYNAPAYNPPTYGAYAAGASPALDPSAFAAQQADAQWLLKSAQIRQMLDAMKAHYDVARLHEPPARFDKLVYGDPALSELKSIAATAVNQIAPALDALTRGASKRATEQAWKFNRQLQAITLPSEPAQVMNPFGAYAKVYSDKLEEHQHRMYDLIVQAWRLVDNMYNFYEGAFSASQRSSPGSATAGWAQAAGYTSGCAYCDAIARHGESGYAAGSDAVRRR